MKFALRRASADSDDYEGVIELKTMADLLALVERERCSVIVGKLDKYDRRTAGADYEVLIYDQFIE